MARKITLQSISNTTSIKGGFVDIYNDNNDEVVYDINALYQKIEDLETENASLKKQVVQNRAKIDAIINEFDDNLFTESNANYQTIMKYLNYITGTLATLNVNVPDFGENTPINLPQQIDTLQNCVDTMSSLSDKLDSIEAIVASSSSSSSTDTTATIGESDLATDDDVNSVLGI